MLACMKNRAVLGIEPRTSRTLSENHTTRPNSLYAHTPHWFGAWSGRSASLLAIRTQRANPAPAWHQDWPRGMRFGKLFGLRVIRSQRYRHLWDSNPRGETPSAQQADALTARPK